jgi:hypothetical protein
MPSRHTSRNNLNDVSEIESLMFVWGLLVSERWRRGYDALSMQPRCPPAVSEIIQIIKAYIMEQTKYASPTSMPKPDFV